MSNEWREVTGWPHSVSDEGRVARTTTRYGNSCFKLLTPGYHADGYLTVVLEAEGSRLRTTVSRLVCEAFHGAPPSDAHQAAHNDGNPGNNRYTNLRWATPKENSADRIAHGTAPVGERNGHKFTREEAYAMRNEYWVARARTGGNGTRLGNGEKQAIQGRYSVGATVLGQIVTGKLWAPICVFTLAAFLSGCGASTPVVTEAPRLVIPASLKTCPPQPEPPPDSAPDVDLWNWVVDLAAAGQSCRDTLSAVIQTIGQ